MQKWYLKSFIFYRDFENNVIYVLGFLEMLLIFSFLMGIKKRFTYGTILLLHGVSTFSSFKQYLNPFEGANLLFFAAWPMLAACLFLYLMRDQDRIFIWPK